MRAPLTCAVLAEMAAAEARAKVRRQGETLATIKGIDKDGNEVEETIALGGTSKTQFRTVTGFTAPRPANHVDKPRGPNRHERRARGDHKRKR